MKYKILIIALLWIILAVLINPAAECYYSDDWAYSRPVLEYLNTGRIHITNWSSMTLIVHIYWGVLFCKLFGYSLTVLKIAELVIGLGGIIATIYFLREFIKDEAYIFFSALLVFFNPVYFVHSYIFMTDVTYYAILMLACIFFIRFVKDNKLLDFIAANIFCLLALLTREVAFVIPPAFAAVYLLRHGFSRRNMAYSMFSILLVLAAFGIYRYWLVNIHGLPLNTDYSRNRMINVFFREDIIYIILEYSKNTILTLVFFGLFFFPLIYYSFRKDLQSYNNKRNRNLIIILMIMFIIIAFPVFWRPKLYAEIYNLTFNNVYLFYFWIPDIHKPSPDTVFIFPRLLASGLIIIGILGGVMASYLFVNKIYLLFKNNRKGFFKRRDGNTDFLLICIFLYIVPILSQRFMNRYLLPVVPFLLVLFYRERFSEYFNRRRIWLSIIYVIFLAYYTTASTHDLQAFLRAKAKAVNLLENEMKIPPEKIDGGIEYNASHFFDFYYVTYMDMNTWWVQNDEYIIVWGEIKDGTLLAKFSYSRWMPPGRTDYIYVYRKD